VQDTPRAEEYYGRDVDAPELGERVVIPDGGRSRYRRMVGHRIGAMRSSELGTLSRETIGATTVRVDLEVDDPDAVHARAVSPQARRSASPLRTAL